MHCLKYASNGRDSIGGKLADVALNCQSLKHIQNTFTQVHSPHLNTTQELN